MEIRAAVNCNMYFLFLMYHSVFAGRVKKPSLPLQNKEKIFAWSCFLMDLDANAFTGCSLSRYYNLR